MGRDTNLYLNKRWELNDIKAVIERITGESVKVESRHKISIGYFTFIVKNMGINVFADSHTPIGPATSLMHDLTPEAQQLFKDIANVLGGFYQEDDSVGSYDWINGEVSDDDGLQYFLKYTAIHDGVTRHDLTGYIIKMSQWYDRVESAKRPHVLSRLQDVATEYEDMYGKIDE
jgi:hypothetical protein